VKNIDAINEYKSRRNMVEAMHILEDRLAEKRLRIRINWFKFIRAWVVVGVCGWILWRAFA
jgi:hypothetical protein